VTNTQRRGFDNICELFAVIYKYIINDEYGGHY